MNHLLLLLYYYNFLPVYYFHLFQMLLLDLYCLLKSQVL